MRTRHAGSRPRWVWLVVLALVAVACGSQRSDEEFAVLVDQGYRPGLLGGGPAGGQGGQAPDLSGIGSGQGGQSGGGQPGQAPDPQPTDGAGSPAAPDQQPGTTQPGPGGAPEPGGAAPDQPAPDQPAPEGGDGSGGGQQNTASDTGVTPTSIKVGNIVSRGGPLGPDVFSPPYFGAQAYFELINQRDGGINGRRVEFVTCDDKEDPQANRQCVNKLVNEDQVFAMVAVSTRAYEGAEIVSSSGLPDVGGQPIGSEMWTYPGMYAIRGSEYPQDGQVGFNGKFYGGTIQFQWFQQNLQLGKAGVVYYEIPESKAAGLHFADALEHVGYEVSTYAVNAALPNWDSVVNQMRSEGVEGVWDTIDFSGKQNLCRSVERNGLALKAMVSTSQGWTQDAKAYSGACRQALYAVSESRPNSDTSHPGVKEFRDTMQALYGGQFDGRLHQWHLEGWAAARLFADAVRAQGPNLTRAGVMKWLDDVSGYTADGLLGPTEWTPRPYDQRTTYPECVVIGQWDEQASNFVLASQMPFCLDNVDFLPWQPAT